MQLLQEFAHRRGGNARLLGERGGGLHALRLTRKRGKQHRGVVGQPADAQHEGTLDVTRTILVLIVLRTKPGTPATGLGAIPIAYHLLLIWGRRTGGAGRLWGRRSLSGRRTPVPAADTADSRAPPGAGSAAGGTCAVAATGFAILGAPFYGAVVVSQAARATHAELSERVRTPCQWWRMVYE